MAHSFHFSIKPRHLSANLLSVLLVCFLTACTSVAHFSDNSQLKILPTKNENFTVSVSNWSVDHSLALLNGGPYSENNIQLPASISQIQRMGEKIVALSNNNDLYILDFSVNPAKQILHAPMDEEVTALAIHDNDVVVGFKETGIFRLKITEKKSIKKSKISSVANVTQIRINKNIAYLLSSNIIVRQPLIESNKSIKSTSWLLPKRCNDFDLLDDSLVLIGPEFGLGIVNTTNPGTFTATLKLQGSKQQLSLLGTTALIADGIGGLVLVDLQEQNKPRWLGSHNKLGSIGKILTSDTRSFVVDRNIRLASLNINNQELPITGSFYKPESQINDALLGQTNKKQGDVVFIATSLGVEKIIFPAGSHGQISNEGINQGGTRRAYIADGLAYVADWFSGLHIYDISDPSQPRHLGNMHTPGSSKGVVVEDGYAYVGDDDYGLQIVDVRDPTKPVTVGSVLTTGLAYTLKKRDELIFLADHRGGFHIINVKDVTKPFIVSSYNTQGKSWAIDVQDDIVYVADDTSGLLVFDISNLDNPKQIGQFDPSGQAEDVVIRDNHAYVSFFDEGLYVLDISKPAQPTLISHLPVPGNARSVVLQDKYAYIAGWESGLHVIDISESKSPKIVGSYDTKGSAWGADIDGNYAYVWDWWGGVKVIDVTNPVRPTLKSQYHANSKINKLRQKNNFIYTANHAAGVQVFDANNVLNPIWSTGTDVNGNVLDVWPSDGLPLLFAVSDEEGLLVFDIADPFYIHLLSKQRIDGTAKLVREDNGNIFVATSQGELLVFTIDQEYSLSKKQILRLDVNDLWVDGNVLYVASKTEGLLNLTIDHQGKIKPRKKLVDEKVYILGASEKYISAATVNFGVDIWERTPRGVRPLVNINVADQILGLAIQGTSLLVLTSKRGLMHFDISNSDLPRLNARYPSTDNYSDILMHNNAVFFAGQDTIASVQLLPKLQWKLIDDNKLRVSLPEKLPIGNYHLAITDLKGNEYMWPNALSVQLKKSGKPKLSIEDFQKLLEQYRKNQ